MPFKTYTLNNGQRYSFAGSSSGPASGGQGGSIGSGSTAYPFPTDAQCTTAQPPQQLACPAMVRLPQHCVSSHSALVVQPSSRTCLPLLSAHHS
jgi:hypothetical protein